MLHNRCGRRRMWSDDLCVGCGRRRRWRGGLSIGKQVAIRLLGILVAARGRCYSDLGPPPLPLCYIVGKDIVTTE